MASRLPIFGDAQNSTGQNPEQPGLTGFGLTGSCADDLMSSLPS